MVGLGEKSLLEVKWILIFLCLEEKVMLKLKGFLFLYVPVLKQIFFIEAFRALLGDLSLFPTALIG